MTEVRRADRAAQRRAAIQVAIITVAGALLLIGFEQYRIPLRDWLFSEPEKVAHRARLVWFLFAALLSVPLVAFAVRLWSLGTRVIAAAEFPPPGYRVIRDTPVTTGRHAVTRGKGIKGLALCLGALAALLWLVLWQLATLLSALAV